MAEPNYDVPLPSRGVIEVGDLYANTVNDMLGVVSDVSDENSFSYVVPRGKEKRKEDYDAIRGIFLRGENGSLEIVAASGHIKNDVRWIPDNREELDVKAQ